MKERLIERLDGADLFLRNRVNAKPLNPLNKYDIENFKDIAKVCDEAARTLEKAIVPSVMVGDIVYALWEVPTETKYIVYCAEVKKISQYKKNCQLTTFFEIEPIEFRGRRKEYQTDDFGKTVFLTKEEAETKLKERDNK